MALIVWSTSVRKAQGNKILWLHLRSAPLHNPDRRIGFVTQRVLLEQLNDDLWRIFTKDHEERELICREYNEIAMHTQNPTTTEQASDQTRDEGMGPLEDL